MENKPKGVVNMSIIKILVKTIIRVACCAICVFGVLTEGLTKIFGKLANYLDTLDDKADHMFEKKKKVKEETVDVPV